MPFFVQTRASNGEIKQFPTLIQAFEEARANKKVEKISFTIDEFRVRLVKTDIGWVYEDVFGNREV